MMILEGMKVILDIIGTIGACICFYWSFKAEGLDELKWLVLATLILTATNQ